MCTLKHKKLDFLLVLISLGWVKPQKLPQAFLVNLNFYQEFGHVCMDDKLPLEQIEYEDYLVINRNENDFCSSMKSIFLFVINQVVGLHQTLMM